MEPGVGSAMAEGLVVGLFSVVLILALIGTVRLTKRLTRAAKSLPQDLAKKASTRKLTDSEAEERLYEFVRQELESGEIRNGLWTKAEATANSIEKAAIRARYIQLRFEQLEAQGQLQRHELNEAEKSAPEDTFRSSETVEKHEVDDSKPIRLYRSSEIYRRRKSAHSLHDSSFHFCNFCRHLF
jgi:hypothetical protein